MSGFPVSTNAKCPTSFLMSYNFPYGEKAFRKMCVKIHTMKEIAELSGVSWSLVRKF